MEILDLRNNLMLREELLDALESVLKSHSSDFRDTISYVLDNKFYLLEIFNTHFYENDDNITELIFPAITRLYGKYFVTPPTLLKSDKLELYQLSFNIDNFIDYFIDILPKVQTKLKHFKYLDRSAETLSLVVDNYIAEQFKFAYECQDIATEIREIKLKKLIREV